MRNELDQGLLPELRRLTNVLVLEEGRGWITHPYHDARSWLDEDDRSEVENAIAFFITTSAVMRRDMVPATLDLANSLWGAQTTYSDCTEYAASLPTSTPAEITAITAAS